MVYDPDNHIGELPRIPLVVLEHQRIVECLLQNDGNRTRAARELGISVRNLQRRLKAWGESVPPAPLGRPPVDSAAVART
jgi:DNA-binding NtrC family response regulator